MIDIDKHFQGQVSAKIMLERNLDFKFNCFYSCEHEYLLALPPKSSGAVKKTKYVV